MLKYKIFGRGVPVVFLHGFMGNLDSFFGLARELSVNAKVVLVDFGFHEENQQVKRLDDYVFEVRELLNKESIPEAFFVCHSFGGRVGVRLSANFPQYVKGLVLIDSAGLKPRRGLGYYFKVFVHKTLKKLGKRGLKGSLDYRNLSPTMKKTFSNIVNDFNDDDLKYITFKVLLVWGSRDRSTPLYMARRYRRLLQISELYVFKGVGHYSYLERSKETLRLLKAYIGGDD